MGVSHSILVSMKQKGMILTVISAVAYGLVPLFSVYLIKASFDAISITFLDFV